MFDKDIHTYGVILSNIIYNLWHCFFMNITFKINLPYVCKHCKYVYSCDGITKTCHLKKKYTFPYVTQSLL